MSKDYYKILGVEKNASADEIKKAFRKKAHKLHPDKQGGDEAKFKEVNEAYQVLGDQQKRAQYDQFGSAGMNGAGGFGGGMGGFSWEDIARAQGMGGRGVHFDMGDLGDIFGDFFGGGFGRNRFRGQDLSMNIKLDFKEAVFGMEYELNVKDLFSRAGITNSTGKDKMKIRIPEGISHGERIKLAGMGGPGQQGAPNGDLYVTILLEPIKDMKREADNMYSVAHISLTQAMLGDKIEVETLDGEVTLKIPSGTQSGVLFRLRGHGVPHMRSRGRGDHYVEVIVDIPKKLNRKQKKLVEELQKEGL